jgi:integrase
MARAIHKLTAREVETLGPGRHSDGGNLYLCVDKDGRRRWMFIFAWRGKQPEAGLGSAAKGGALLKAVRARAAEGRAMLEAGLDPRTALNKPAAEEVPTFGAIADAFLETHEGSFRNEKHKAQWRTTLTRYCAPIRNAPVDSIDTEAVLSVLKPLWTRTPETASRVRGRIEAVWDAARALGHIDADRANPARWRGHLDKLLPKRPKLTRGRHAAMPYADVHAFMARLRERPATAARSLEFGVLTAARSGEILGAQWPEIDLDARVWTIPAKRMKAGREHRVPLSGRAVAILREMETGRTSDFVFPGLKRGRPLSATAFEMLLRRMGIKDATTHGFRSAFRDWTGNETNFPRELAEHALAHVIGDKAEQAYRRSDALERRRELMDAWANYCEHGARDNVLAFKRPA